MINSLKSWKLFISVITATHALTCLGLEAQTKTVWLSELDLTKMSAGWGKPVADKSIQNNVLSIGGRKYDRGVGSHAESIMYIDLDGKTKKFSAFVGVDDEVEGHTGSVRFRIFGEEGKLFDSGTMKAGQDARKIEIDLTGIKKLTLIADGAGDNISYDHADWADARFVIEGKSPKAVTAPKEERIILTPEPGAKPKINGPKIYGARPGNTFIYRVPATGKRPMKFSAPNLPKSLQLNRHTGIIRGKTPDKAGNYTITLIAENSFGKARREFTIVAGETLALTPPMGWNSWYIHYNRVTDSDMRKAADAMINSGMADYGYQYVNIDDCWSKKKGDTPYRTEDGDILPNEKFPDMKKLTEYIHSKGLKAGIYTSPGPWNCAGYTGSFDHELQDAMTFADWGFDFLKYDWCSYGQKAKNNSVEELMKPYLKMGNILKDLNRDIVLNLCQYGMGNVWLWGGKVGGNCWRTTGDLGLMSGFLEVGLSNADHWQYAKPGQWNDPDYILIGWVGNAHGMGIGTPTDLTPNQQYSYMSMWCLMASPLIFSGDMTKLDEFTVNVLCNAEVIEIDQDILGKQGRIVQQTDDYFIMVKDMADGSKAVGLFNTTEIPISIKADWNLLDIKGNYRIRDLWRHKDLGTFRDQYTAQVPRRGVMMIRCFKEKD